MSQYGSESSGRAAVAALLCPDGRQQADVLAVFGLQQYRRVVAVLVEELDSSRTFMGASTVMSSQARV